MIIFELVGSEKHPAYKALEVSNGSRHYDFLQSIVRAALEIGRPFLSSAVIQALNYHAIACLHVNAGEYRPCSVTVGTYVPPEPYRVPALMDDLVNTVNRNWDSIDAVLLASYVLWRMNSIHPFINGNGRTARAACYFVLCLKAGGWLTGAPILPELIRQHHDEYVEALKKADASLKKGPVDLTALHALLVNLLNQQMSSAAPKALPAPNQRKKKN